MLDQPGVYLLRADLALVLKLLVEGITTSIWKPAAAMLRRRCRARAVLLARCRAAGGYSGRARANVGCAVWGGDGDRDQPI
jgi:hypothetical protein